MINKRIVEIIVTVVVLGYIFFAYNYFALSKQVTALEAQQNQVVLNTKVINFAELFIQKVLQADKEVDFETRLSLENSVRDLKDDQIMAEWQHFTGSKTEAEAQNSVKKLLGILISKIQK